MSRTQPSGDLDVSSKVIGLLKELSCVLSPSSQSSHDDATKSNKRSKFRDEVADNELYEFAEHKHLGDGITLKGHGKQPFALRNNLSLTYGQISGLAGDFFGTLKPICLGTTNQDREGRFSDAYDTLVAPDNDANDILTTLEKEIESMNKAKQQQELKQGIFSTNYHPTPWWSLQWAAMRASSNTPSYLRLGAINLDHFGQDARTAYNTGHRVALNHAAKASLRNSSRLSPEERRNYLVDAYTMNAFADHFLEDQFASGHLRTPRRQLLDSLDGSNWASLDDQAKNICAKAMHDEDNRKGLMVQSPDRPEPWRVFGDGHLLDSENSDAVKQCIKALQASADEVYEAWQNATIPADKDFKAWHHAPILESVTSPDNFPPMFNHEGKVRKPLDGAGPFTYVRVEDWIEVRKTVEPQPLDRGEVHVGVGGLEEGYLFSTANARAEGSVYEIKDSGGDKHQFLGGKVGATAGSYLGLDASVHAYKLETEGAKLKLGLGVDTGAGIHNGSAEVKIFGTGLSFGREIGFSFVGSEFKLKLW